MPLFLKNKLEPVTNPTLLTEDALGLTTQLGYDLPEVTVGIPFYEQSNPHYLRQAIDSVLAQTHRPFAVHLIQDGRVSSEIERIVDEYAERYSCITVLRLPEHQGLPAALNESILRCTSRYYARMDSDDICHPERLYRQVTMMENNPAIDILGTWASEFINDPDEPNCFIKQMPQAQSQIARMYHYRCPFIHPSVMFRKSVFARIGLYNTTFRSAQDYALWGKALKRGIGVANLPEPLLFFRANGVLERRRRPSHVLCQFRAAYTYHTWSPLLNIIKLGAILIRFFPLSLQRWAYRNLR